MKRTASFENLSASYVMAVALCLAFLSYGLPAHAEEDTTEDNEVVVTSATTNEAETVEGKKRAAMLKQIESLRAIIAERKSQMQTNHQERVEDRKEMVAEKKAEFKIDKAAFMANLEGLDEAGKRAAMIEFISKIKAAIEAKKAEHSANKQEMKEERKEMKDEKKSDRADFHSSLEGLSREAKLTAIMERVAALKQQMKERMKLEEDEMEDEDAS